MVQKWKESEMKMAQAFTTNGAHRKKIHQNEQPLHQKLEENMLNWFISQEKEALCDKSIRTRALLIARDIGLENFKGSSGWVSSFRQRHSIFKGSSKVTGNNHIIPTSTHPSANAFLTCTNQNDTVKLDFINEEAGTHQPTPTDKIAYYDYRTPEHNYCRPVTMAMSVNTTRLLDRSVYNPWDDAMLWSGIFDQQVLYMYYCIQDNVILLFYFKAIGPEDSIDFTDSTNDIASRLKPLCTSSDTAIDIGYLPSLDVEGVLTIGSRTHQPEFTFEPEFVFIGQ